MKRQSRKSSKGERLLEGLVAARDLITEARGLYHEVREDAGLLRGAKHSPDEIKQLLEELDREEEELLGKKEKPVTSGMPYERAMHILMLTGQETKESVQKRYHFMAKKFHPDQNPDNKDAAEAMLKELNEAYKVVMERMK